MSSSRQNSVTILALGISTSEFTTVVQLLSQDNYVVYVAHTVADGRRLLAANQPTLILIGELSPGEDHAALLAFLRTAVPDALLLACAPTDETDPALADFDDVITTPITAAAVRRRVQVAARLQQSNAALHASEMRFQQTFETNQAIKLIINPENGRIVAANQAACDFYGYSQAELTALRITDINVMPEAEVHQEMQHAKEENRRFFNFRHRLASGEIRHVEVNSGPLQMPDGKFLYSVVQDVTERYRTEQALQESEARYRAVVTATPNAIVMVKNGRYIFANPASARLLGYNHPDDLINVPVLDTISPAYHELFRQRMTRLAEGEENPPIELQLVHADGSTIWVESTSLNVTVQGEKVVLIIGRNVTVQKETLARLRESENLLRQQLELSLSLSAVSGFEATLQTCLAAALSVSGMDTAVLYLHDEHSATPHLSFAARTPELLSHVRQHSQYDIGLVIKDLPQSPAYYNHQELFSSAPPESPFPFSVKVLASIPLHHKGQPLGILGLGSFSLNVIPQQTRTALETIANQIGAVIVQAHAENKLIRLSRAVEQSPVSIVITDLNGRIEYINPKFTQLTGYTPADIIGQNPSVLKSGFTPAEEYAHLWQTIQAGQEWHGEFRNVKKNGEHYWESARISPIVNASGEITHFLAVKEDLTASKQMQMELEKRNRELLLLNRAGRAINSSLDVDKVLMAVLEETRILLNITACSVWLLDETTGELVCHEVTDPLGQIVKGWRLPPGKGLAGWVAQQGVSLVVGNVLTDKRHFAEVDSQTGMKLRSILTVPLLLHEKVIGVFQVVDSAENRFNEHDLEIMESLAAVAANAIEHAHLHESLKKQYQTLQQTQTRLIQSEKLAAIGEIVAGVAHELNNPLAATILYSQLLQRKGVSPELQRDLDQVVSQARRASDIVRGLLDFARQRPPERIETNINAIILSTLSLLAYELRTHNIETYTQLSEEAPPILADPHQLQQVLVNLINNASQAMLAAHKTGHLTITTAVATSAGLKADQPGRPVLRIIIQDDGPGIPAALQLRIFDPFFTTKEEGQGTGLGLAVCHGIITEHGGDIWVESREGQGASFFVELPLISATAVVPTPPLPSTPPRANGSSLNTPHHILVVDDEPSLVQIITRLLRRQNYVVETAENGAEGLERLAQARYDLIICDLRMPGMSGIEFYEEALLSNPRLQHHIIFTTGDTISPSARHFLSHNNLTYLAKPFDINDLLQTIHTLLPIDD
jgi:PAS domain S-box-containing protein